MLFCALVLHVTARPRSPALQPFVRSFHYHESNLAPAIERILPNGQAHLLINLDENEFRTYSGSDCNSVRCTRGATFAGPHGRATGLDTREQRRLMAVEFKLGGAASFIQMPMSEAVDQAISVDDLWGHDGRTLRERLCEAGSVPEKFSLLESVLLERFVWTSDPAVEAGMLLLEQGTSLNEARLRLGLLPKTFVRRFRDQVGLTPKRFARVRRLQRVLGCIGDAGAVDWCRVAADQGFTDQAHLIHDFRDLTGLTPSAYRPSSRQRRNHVPVAPLEL